MGRKLWFRLVVFFLIPCLLMEPARAFTCCAGTGPAATQTIPSPLPDFFNQALAAYLPSSGTLVRFLEGLGRVRTSWRRLAMNALSLLPGTSTNLRGLHMGSGLRLNLRQQLNLSQKLETKLQLQTVLRLLEKEPIARRLW